ncbi:MAG TPA: DNA polymerase III subunit delta' [Stellaceae bacterium]|nr:DNA polymerase III subunit delta' [Stellaceae bacterium]
MTEFEEEDDEEAGGGEGALSPLLGLPRENPSLIGHREAEQTLLRAALSRRMPHAWLLSGPRGIGKATLAFRFARFLLTKPGLPTPTSLAIDPAEPTFRRVASGGHADLLLVERGFDEQKKRQRTEIIVEETRTIANFFHLTPAEDGFRIVIVDGADQMNRNAANALLKILEEPPERSVLLLCCESLGRLPATIRSRCRHLKLAPLTSSEMEEALARIRPDIKGADLALLQELAEGSLGRALELAAAEGVVLYRGLVKLMATLPTLDAMALHGLADHLAAKGAEERYRMMAELLPDLLARRVVGAARGMSEEGAGFLGRRGLDHWVEVWEKITHLFAQADSINLDRKQVVLNSFFALEEAAR